MNAEIYPGLLIPFLGTTAGAACVLLMKKTLGRSVQRALTGFASGVMVAASIWSLLTPAMEQEMAMAKFCRGGNAIAGDATLLMDNGNPSPQDGVEERGFPHIRASDNGDDWQVVLLHNKINDL